METLLFVLTLAAALGSALVAGVFFAFSSFVMKALARLPESRGMAAMQSINDEVLRSSFLALLFATAAACVFLVACAFSMWGHPRAAFLLAGGLVYLLGVMGVTIAIHVPRNKALARVDPAGTDAAGRWNRYIPVWTAWNHVRTIAALVAALLLALALH